MAARRSRLWLVTYLSMLDRISSVASDSLAPSPCRWWQGLRALATLVLVASVLTSGPTPGALAHHQSGTAANLVVSFADAEVQSFPESDAGETESVAHITFANLGSPCSTSAFTNGTQIQAQNIRTGNTVNVGTGSGALDCANAGVYGGAGGQGFYVAPGAAGWTIAFTNQQRYVGFWWSAGNPGNTVQLQDSAGTTLATFGSEQLYEELLGGSARRCGGSGSTAPTRGADYCGNPNLTIGTTTYTQKQVQGEPYAFIHLRMDHGFQRVRFSGTGFETDNITFSETVPTFGAAETVVGDNPVTSTWPDVLLVDPRATSVALPGLALGASNEATICISQVQNAGGTALSGSPTISVTRDQNTAGVTALAGTNPWSFTGSRGAIQEQIPLIRIQSSTGTNPLVSSGSLWVRLSVDSGATCPADPDVTRIVELRSLGVTERKTVGLTL